MKSFGVHGEFTWCLHCERVFKTEKWIVNDEWCPNPAGCDGGGFGVDGFSWDREEWPRNTNPDYPDIPVEGERYPLYGGKEA